MKLRALIADDEPLARERMRFLLSRLDGVEVAGECRNGREVLQELKQNRPDVLFLDIQMPGMSGLELMEQIGPAQMPVTVFVTAHHHYAVQAFEVHALDYLTKPVEAERLQATLVRVRERVASQTALLTQEQLKSVLAGMSAAAGASWFITERVIPLLISTRSNGLKRQIITHACTSAAKALCCARPLSNWRRRWTHASLCAFTVP